MRRFITIFLAMLTTLYICSVPVLAATTPPYEIPAVWTVDSVDVYQHNFETDDQLWIVGFNVQYPTADQPNISIDNTFLLRLMHSGSEVTATAPLGFFNSGYAKGYASFYFPNGASNIPTFSGVTYNMNLAGNPSISWNNTAVMSAGVNNAASINWHTSASVAVTKVLLLAKFRSMAQELQSLWGDLTHYTLYNYLDSGITLTSTGELYFTNIIPSIRTLVPSFFMTSSQPARYEPDKTFTQTYANTQAGKLTGTALDFANFGSAISGGHMTGIQASSITYFIILLGVSLVLAFSIFRIPPVASIVALVILNIGLILGVPMGLMSFIYAGVFYGVEFMIAALIFLLSKL